jgi:hypothetical protein
MTDQRVAALSRNLRTQGYLDNDPDATLAAMRLIVLADALEEHGWAVRPGSEESRSRIDG